MFTGLKKLLAIGPGQDRDVSFGRFLEKFQSILEKDNLLLENMADMGDKLGGEYVFDRHYIEQIVEKISDITLKLISEMGTFGQKESVDLLMAYERIHQLLTDELSGKPVLASRDYVLGLHPLGYDVAEQIGSKMANIRSVSNHIGLPVPDGFVITTGAFLEVLKRTGLIDKINQAADYWEAEDLHGLKLLADEVQQSIQQATLPRRLTAEILTNFDQLARRLDTRQLRIAMRSSGWCEDGSNAFAGQYESCLNVSRDKVLDSYRRVIASTYHYEAWCYRLARGYQEHEVAMAVGCQVMADCQVSGVVHTFAPHLAAGAMFVSAVWGLCGPVVQGSTATDTFVVERMIPHSVRSQQISEKTRQLVAELEGSTSWGNVAPEDRSSSCLTSVQLHELAESAMRIERFFKRPQEIEWCFNRDGKLTILQARPLLYRGRRGFTSPLPDGKIAQAEVALSDCGFIVQCGVAVGRIHRVEDDHDLEKIPQGAIILSKYASPRFGAVMHKINGIITDIGSPTGHMAALAREFRVPAIVDTGVATGLLADGDEVTLDASQKKVYRGHIVELKHFELSEEDEPFEDTYEYRLLRRLLRHITPLFLVNSQSEDFTPASCVSYHDISRYIVEKAKEKLILFSESRHVLQKAPPKKLISSLPLGLLVIDAGGGTSASPESREITGAQIISTPLRDLLHGMCSLGMWCTDPVAVGMGSFMASLSKTFPTTLSTPKEVGRNLAVVLENYMHISLRLGYHFTIIDASVSRENNSGFIYFSFMGGVTEYIRRARRAAFIAKVLERYDFRVEVHRDFVVGRIKKISHSRIAARMNMLGALIGYTRQLDAQMNSDEDVVNHAESFISAMNSIVGG